MDRDHWRSRLKESPRLKRLLDFIIMNQVQTRPRWYVRLLAPLYQHRGRHSVIYSSVRMDTPPYRRFSLGDYSVVESFSCINNAIGDVTIGDHSRIGLHTTVIGPVTIGNHVNIGQCSIITALIHNSDDTTRPIDMQGVSSKPIVIEDDVWVGANVSVLPGVRIGTRSIIAAGAVVTRDVPAHTLVAGVPAVVKKNI